LDSLGRTFSEPEEDKAIERFERMTATEDEGIGFLKHLEGNNRMLCTNRFVHSSDGDAETVGLS
jgi:hypothetical protein